MVYAVVKPFDEAIQLGQIRKVKDVTEDLSSPYESTVNDKLFCERMLHLGLQILMYLGSLPLEYEPEKVLRKPRIEGKHHLPGLYAARFVGASQLRPASGRTGQASPRASTCQPTGAPVTGHASPTAPSAASAS